MLNRDDLPETPEWQPEPKPWDESACCASCAGICESTTQAAWMHGVDAHIQRGEN